MAAAQLDEQFLDAKLTELEQRRQWSPRVVSRLETMIRTAGDLELYRINPIRYATDKGMTEAEAIDLFLLAVRCGLFEMDWNVVCPGCGAVVGTGHHLSDIRSEFDCVGCAKHAEHASMDDEIYVSFTISPGVRKISTPQPEQGPYVVDVGMPYLSGKRLITTQTFRDLFRSETVYGEEGIGIKDITIVFTDLKDSTQLYDEIGDPKAYYLVRQHFETLGKIVAQYEGATIKTIGDAVMATFLTPLDAVKATRDMLRGIAEFNRNIREELILKIGMHRGRSIAVTLNERLDYFGQTVNIASRVQGLAGAGEIVITQAIYDYPGVKDALAGCKVSSEQAALRGVNEMMQVYRVASGK